LFYLKKAAGILEIACGPEHPMVANCYSLVSFCYHDNHKTVKATQWMRRGFCLFYVTLGTSNEVTIKSYNHLLRLEGTIGTKYQFLSLEQLALSLIEYLENEEQDDYEDSDQEEEKEQAAIKSDKQPLSIKTK
jgi:hypothetical protein